MKAQREQPNQRRVLLSLEERLALLREVDLPPDLRTSLDTAQSSRPLEVWFTLDEAEDLRERVGEALQVKGFDESYRTTALGRILESLIDKLHVP